MVEEKYNRKNPAVKRILQEVKEMQTNPSDDFICLPLEENIFEWQFAICGPRDSEFEGGIYHGRIQLPSEYPLKPPAYMLLTPNGRFETQTKICLSISNHHPEHWQPSWSVRTALVALIAFMPTNPDGALGSLDFKKEERRVLAIKSREVIPKYGTAERQKLIEEIHQYMLTKAPPVPQLEPTPETNQSASTVEAEDNAIAAVEETTNPAVASEAAAEIVEEVHQVQVNANVGRLRVRFAVGVGQRITEPRIQRQQEMAEEAPQRNELLEQKNAVAGRGSTEDRFYTLAAMGLTAAILILLLKKYLKSVGFAGFEGGSQK